MYLLHVARHRRARGGPNQSCERLGRGSVPITIAEITRWQPSDLRLKPLFQSLTAVRRSLMTAEILSPFAEQEIGARRTRRLLHGETSTIGIFSLVSRSRPRWYGK